MTVNKYLEPCRLCWLPCDVLRKIEEYAKRYGVEPVIDITPLN